MENQGSPVVTPVVQSPETDDAETNDGAGYLPPQTVAMPVVVAPVVMPVAQEMEMVELGAGAHNREGHERLL